MHVYMRVRECVYANGSVCHVGRTSDTIRSDILVSIDLRRSLLVNISLFGFV